MYALRDRFDLLTLGNIKNLHAFRSETNAFLDNILDQ